MNAPQTVLVTTTAREHYVTMAKAVCFEQALREVLLVEAGGLEQAHAIARQALRVWNRPQPRRPR
jgi:hypothetical protein